jgi:hypothetical protein
MRVSARMIGKKVEIAWREWQDDWKFFTVMDVSHQGQVELRGEDMPDGAVKHDGDSFWCNQTEILRIREI